MGDEGDLFFYAIVGFFIGLFFFIKGVMWFRQKRMIENTPTSKVRSIAMGHVEVFGSVVPDKILKSPLSDKDCVYYKYTVEEYRNSGKHSHWATVRSGEDRINFYVKDDTGSVLVNPTKAQIDIPADLSFESGLGKDPPQSVKEFLKTSNLSFEGFLGFNKKMRYREWFIAPKDKLYVMGTAGDNPFIEEATSKAGIEDVMIHKGDSIFYISDKPEKDILRKLTWKVLGGMIGGPILSAACLGVIFLYLGLL